MRGACGVPCTRRAIINDDLSRSSSCDDDAAQRAGGTAVMHRWRVQTFSHLVPMVRAGVPARDGEEEFLHSLAPIWGALVLKTFRGNLGGTQRGIVGMGLKTSLEARVVVGRSLPSRTKPLRRRLSSCIAPCILLCIWRMQGGTREGASLLVNYSRRHK